VRFISENITNPYWNLAAEEYLLKYCAGDYFRLWRNASSVIVGRNQNTLAEIDTAFVEQNSIAVVRRLSGGGAVFHDLGNLNFSFICDSKQSDDSVAIFKRYSAPIIEALRGLGLNAQLNGRNDILVDGAKVSGCAVARHKGRVLMHGTLLFSASMAYLAGALRSRPEKFVDKAVKSVRSRVSNISLLLSGNMTIEEFKEYLIEYVSKGYDIYRYSDRDIERIEALSGFKYSSYDWNYGSSPRYEVIRLKKFPYGLVEFYMNIERGYISQIDIRGDYMFSKPSEEISDALTYTRYVYNDILERLSAMEIGEYIVGATPEDIAKLIS
jgi:lipoate-protein ligase A